jgi:hypothetical protein
MKWSDDVRTTTRRASERAWRLIPLWVAIAASPVLAQAADEGAGCFDVAEGFADPLIEPMPYHGADLRVEYGERPDGTAWAATRVVVDLPPEVVVAKVRDHRNIKDMKNTELSTRDIDSADYLDLRHVDVDVTVKAALLKVHVRWTEEWAYRIVEGTPEAPRVMVANYQKVAGTHHIRHQCGSYVVRRLGPNRSDLFMYEEIQATRRSAEDTHKMHQRILTNIREDLWPTEQLVADRRVAHAEPASAE